MGAKCFVSGNLEQANLAMKSAYDMITKLKENDAKKQREIDMRCTQAKEKIETLRQAVSDRDKTINELRTMQVCRMFYGRVTDLLLLET